MTAVETDGLRALAGALTNGWASPPGEVAAVLEDAADEIDRLTGKPPPAPPPVTLCPKRAHAQGDGCDRRAGHTGMHTWQIANLARIRDDYDKAVRELAAARWKIAAAETRARDAEADRAAVIAKYEKRRFRLRLPGRHQP